MKNIISINDLSFFYNGKCIFDKFNLDIQENSWVTLIGNSGSGKSTLIRLILGLEKYSGNINIMNNTSIKEIRKNIGVVFSDTNSQFILDTVIDELKFPLYNLGYEDDFVLNRVNEISTIFGIKKLLSKSYKELSGGEKQLITLAVSLVTNPKILILDEALDMLDDKQKQKVLKILNKEYKTGLTIINITQNVDDMLLGSKVLIIDKGQIKAYDDTINIFNNLDVLKELKIDLPFIVDLSIKLKYYGLVNKIYLDMQELIDAIWK